MPFFAHADCSTRFSLHKWACDLLQFPGFVPIEPARTELSNSQGTNGQSPYLAVRSMALFWWAVFGFAEEWSGHYWLGGRGGRLSLKGVVLWKWKTCWTMNPSAHWVRWIRSFVPSAVRRWSRWIGSWKTPRSTSGMHAADWVVTEAGSRKSSDSARLAQERW
jgi:hypothetical protein